MDVNSQIMKEMYQRRPTLTTQLHTCIGLTILGLNSLIAKYDLTPDEAAHVLKRLSAMLSVYPALHGPPMTSDMPVHRLQNYIGCLLTDAIENLAAGGELCDAKAIRILSDRRNYAAAGFKERHNECHVDWRERRHMFGIIRGNHNVFFRERVLCEANPDFFVNGRDECSTFLMNSQEVLFHQAACRDTKSNITKKKKRSHYNVAGYKCPFMKNFSESCQNTRVHYQNCVFCQQNVVSASFNNESNHWHITSRLMSKAGVKVQLKYVIREHVRTSFSAKLVSARLLEEMEGSQKREKMVLLKILSGYENLVYYVLSRATYVRIINTLNLSQTLRTLDHVKLHVEHKRVFGECPEASAKFKM